MSGAAEGIAGLALGSVSIAALFTTVIQCFEIVIAGKNFSEDCEQLCSLFSLQRTRFGLWGESVGLIPNPASSCRLRYDKNLDRPDIRPQVERILHNVKSLLVEAGRMDERYADVSEDVETTTSQGMDVFKESFERFKRRIRKHQRDTSAWKVTRWAINDAGEFEVMINRLEKFVDGLESITKSLGLLEEQHERLREEIESISDVQSLRLLSHAASRRQGSVLLDVSDTASGRLSMVADSISDSESFITARSRQTATSNSCSSRELSIPGAWPHTPRLHSNGRVVVVQNLGCGSYDRPVTRHPIRHRDNALSKLSRAATWSMFYSVSGEGRSIYKWLVVSGEVQLRLWRWRWKWKWKFTIRGRYIHTWEDLRGSSSK